MGWRYVAGAKLTLAGPPKHGERPLGVSAWQQTGARVLFLAPITLDACDLVNRCFDAIDEYYLFTDSENRWRIVSCRCIRQTSDRITRGGSGARVSNAGHDEQQSMR